MAQHTKRVVSPVFWRAGRKNFRWITSPAPGPHPATQSIPLQVLLRDVLGLVKNGREARAAIKQGKVEVDGKPRRDPSFPVGLMDVITIKDIDKDFRVVPHGKGLIVIEILGKDAPLKPVRVTGKQAVKGGKIQVTSHDGQNFLDVKANVGDTLLLKGGEVDNVMALESGALCLVIRGKQAGRMGKLVDGKESHRGLARLKGDDEFDAPFSYIMVIGKKEPVVTLYEETSD